MSATNRMTGTVRTKQACVGSRDRTHRSLRYRPEDMNTIGALAESDASEHAPPRRTHMDHNARGVRPRSESVVNQKWNR